MRLRRESPLAAAVVLIAIGLGFQVLALVGGRDFAKTGALIFLAAGVGVLAGAWTRRGRSG